MSMFMFICFALLWGYTGLQCFMFRNMFALSTFMVATLFFVAGGGVYVVELIV